MHMRYVCINVAVKQPRGCLRRPVFHSILRVGLNNWNMTMTREPHLGRADGHSDIVIQEKTVSQLFINSTMLVLVIVVVLCKQEQLKH